LSDKIRQTGTFARRPNRALDPVASREMNVVVTVKYVPDPQGTPSLGPDNFLVRDGVEGALDPGDEFGVEAALQAVEQLGGEVTAVSVGPEAAASAVQRALAMGAHRGVLVTDDALRGADALATARVLTAAIRRGPFDLVICGVESTDGYTGTLPMTMAAMLEVSSATFARSLEVSDGLARIQRQTESGYDVVECSLPAVVTVTAGATEPRYPSLKGIMQAKQKPFERLSLAELGLRAEDVAPLQRVVEVAEAPGKPPGERIEAGDGAIARIADLLESVKAL
jgi:electron transfer flavoprotein beta subunit